MKIEAESADPQRPFANLLPITEALVAAGNELKDGGFVLTPAGYLCRLANPIDVALVRAGFSLPATIDVSVEYDTIFDGLSWVAIEGPGADGARQRLLARDIQRRQLMTGIPMRDFLRQTLVDLADPAQHRIWLHYTHGFEDAALVVIDDLEAPNPQDLLWMLRNQEELDAFVRLSAALNALVDAIGPGGTFRDVLGSGALWTETLEASQGLRTLMDAAPPSST